MPERGRSVSITSAPDTIMEAEPTPPASTLQLLLWAAESGDVATLRKLVTPGNVNHCDSKYGVTLLGWACANGHAGAVQFLLDSGAEAAVADCEGYAPLHRAAWNGHAEVVRTMAAAGASLRITGKRDGATPLGLVAARGDLALVQLFVRELGIGVNERDARGLTPLAKAAAAGHSPAVEWLLKEGADCSLASAAGDTPRSICDKASERATTRAQQQQYRHIITLLSRGKAPQSVAGVC
eukprot:TRINITY_DN12152_c0_g1_i1.p1 TRINITY_DN12152_c0_g1~~TRINITY_DN12152_c0_g1_i1.p1  ORF type:complete len:265 (+),score=73.87 TRINITY_DN12152_c0_g1_i1:79-795(+)